MNEEELALLYPEMYGEQDAIYDLTIVGADYLNVGHGFYRLV